MRAGDEGGRRCRVQERRLTARCAAVASSWRLSRLPTVCLGVGRVPSLPGMTGSQQRSRGAGIGGFRLSTPRHSGTRMHHSSCLASAASRHACLRTRMHSAAGQGATAATSGSTGLARRRSEERRAQTCRGVDRGAPREKHCKEPPQCWQVTEIIKHVGDQVNIVQDRCHQPLLRATSLLVKD